MTNGAAVAWDLAFVLPNVQLRDRDEQAAALASRLTAKHVALVPPTDPRVAAIRQRSPGTDKLLGGFRDLAGSPVQPVVLIYEKAAPSTVSLESIVAFRNAVALAIALPSWLARGDNAHWIFSDVFDFHPATVAGNDSGLMITSAALKAYWSSSSKFFATTSPHVPRVTLKPGEDLYLLRILTDEWEHAFTTQDGEDSFRRALFRSLELAYAALATPVRNQGSLFDWGISVSLWVSALEILAHPHVTNTKGKVNQKRVLDLLGSYPWIGDKMSSRTEKIHLGDTVRLGTNVELACHRLYRLRHHFMHGDAVARRDFWPYTERCASLIQIAPTLYRLALRAFLARRHPRFSTEPHGVTWDQFGANRDDVTALAADQWLEMQVGELFDEVAEEL